MAHRAPPMEDHAMSRGWKQPSKSLVGLALLIWAIAMFAGCETVERSVKENPKTAGGAGVGGAGGALIGGLAGGAKGAVIGGLVGVLAGGVIGNVLDRQERSREATAQTVGYTPNQGDVVRVEQVTVNPQSIRVGETVNVSVRYAVMTPNGSAPVRVREVREVYRQGQLVGNPVLEIDRQDGTYSSTLPITLPASAASGSYDVVVRVELDGTQDSQQSHFTITR